MIPMTPATLGGSLLLALALVGIPSGPAWAQDAFPPDAPVGDTVTLPGGDEFIILSYHDIRDDAAIHVDPDPYAVSTRQLLQQFEWLRENGYTPVSLDDVVAAREGERPLPRGAVLLTFDDGLKSVHTHLLPILELFRFPAVVAVVTSWLDAPEGWELEYDGIGTLTKEDLLSWDEVRELVESGLVEIASHSHALHQGILANPFGNVQPAAVTRGYDSASGTYETEEEYRERVRWDLLTSSRRIEEETGGGPRAIVWPFGEFNRITEALASELGMTFSMGLHPGTASVHQTGLPRFVISGNPRLPELVWFLEHSQQALIPVRVMQVDLDYVYDPDPAQIERNLDLLVERVHAMGVTTVYLQAFANPEGDGNARALYFPNRHLPVRADLFNRVAWQLRTRAGVQVFGWLPVLAFVLPDAERTDELAVKRWVEGEMVPSRPDFWRLSPYLPEARQIIREIYEDLARSSPLDGLLFDDDAYLSDFEDASLHGDGRLPPARERTVHLIEFTLELAEVARTHRPLVRTARNLYARVVLEPESEEWFSQNLGLFLEAYDQTALMAMPYLERARRPDAWMRGLLEEVAAVPGGLQGTMFELQSVDWWTTERIPTQEMVDWMRMLQRGGAVHFGYYPDDFILGHPNLQGIRQGISVERYPFRRP